MSIDASSSSFSILPLFLALHSFKYEKTLSTEAEDGTQSETNIMIFPHELNTLNLVLKSTRKNVWRKYQLSTWRKKSLKTTRKNEGKNYVFDLVKKITLKFLPGKT